MLFLQTILQTHLSKTGCFLQHGSNFIELQFSCASQTIRYKISGQSCSRSRSHVPFIVGLLNSLVNSLNALKIYVLFIIFIISSCFPCHSIFQDLLIVECEEGTGNNTIAGLFTVLFISNACHHVLQQPKPSILSFIATFVQAENCTEYCSVLIIYFPKVISCNSRFNCQQNTWL